VYRSFKPAQDGVAMKLLRVNSSPCDHGYRAICFAVRYRRASVIDQSETAAAPLYS
jgi:hypothetical protein